MKEPRLRDWHARYCGVNDDMGPTTCDCAVPSRMQSIDALIEIMQTSPSEVARLYGGTLSNILDHTQ